MILPGLLRSLDADPALRDTIADARTSGVTALHDGGTALLAVGGLLCLRTGFTFRVVPSSPRREATEVNPTRSADTHPRVHT